MKKYVLGCIASLSISFFPKETAVSQNQARYSRVPTSMYEAIDPERLINNIRDLSSPAFQGRELGTDGNIKASNWLANEFRKAGLAPGFGTSFTKDFNVAAYALSGLNELHTLSDSLILYDDFLPAYFSPHVSDSAELFFTTDPIDQLTRDSMSGKLVVVFESTLKLNEVLEKDFGNIDSILPYKRAQQIGDKGAKALIIIADPQRNQKPFASGAPYSFDREINLPASARKAMKTTPFPFTTPKESPIPVFFVSFEKGAQLLGLSQGALTSFYLGANQTDDSHIDISTQVHFASDIQVLEQSISSHVAGIRYGIDPDSYIVVYAHIDAEGQHPQFGYPFGGANNNASGIITLLELAHATNSEIIRPQKSIVFLAYNGMNRDLSGLEPLFNNNFGNLSELTSAIELRELGGGLRADSTTVYLSYNPLFRYADMLDQTSKELGFSMRPLTQESRLNGLAFITGLSYSGLVISGGYHPFTNRISDNAERMDFVRLYRANTYILEFLWRVAYEN